MELIPRTTRAQKMDALSSQASLAGYKAAVLAADRLARYYPMLMTAAGTIPPAKVFVIGAGVAGLQALATAKRLGAQVKACDLRPAVQEEVQSLGGQFVALPAPEAVAGSGGYGQEVAQDLLRRQQEVLRPHIAAADVVISTAQVPGKAAPKLITADAVAAMRGGSVVIDLAVEDGGNCELTEAGRDVVHRGVTIIGPANLPAAIPVDASTLYARNILEVVRHVTKDGKVNLDLNDDITKAALLVYQGSVRHEPTARLLAQSK
jgi:NAD(P) transhydrogenase subunit alpha